MGGDDRDSGGGSLFEVQGQIKHRDRVRDLAEVYTHQREVTAMLDLVPDMFPSETDPDNLDKTFLEPAVGHGNFLVEVLRRKLVTVTADRCTGGDFEHRVLRCLASIYGIDIDAENVADTRRRLHDVVAAHVGDPSARSEGFWSAVEVVLTTNIVRADTLADAIVTSSKLLKNAKRENPDNKLTREQKKEQSEAAKRRKEVREKLQKLLAKIPVFMYVTQIREQALKDIILGVDGPLFEKVTGLRVEDFKLLNQIGVFNPIHMNAAIYQFKAFEDSSLEYADRPGTHHTERPIGLWDTVLQPGQPIEEVLGEGIS